MKIMHMIIDHVMYIICMYSTYICITIYYIIQKKSRIYEPNIQKTITNRERMWIVLISVYTPKYSALIYDYDFYDLITVIFVLRPLHVTALTFLKETLQTKVVRFQRSYLLIFNLTLNGDRVRSKSHPCFFLMKHAIFIVDFNTQLCWLIWGYKFKKFSI